MTSTPRVCPHGVEEGKLIPLDKQGGLIPLKCFECICDDAKARCVARGEGWRWGVTS